MIEVVSIEEPKKLDITKEMAFSTARVFKEYCDSFKYCADCPLNQIGCSKGESPYQWTIQER